MVPKAEVKEEDLYSNFSVSPLNRPSRSLEKSSYSRCYTDVPLLYHAELREDMRRMCLYSQMRSVTR